MLITYWKATNFKYLIFKTVSLCQTNSGDKTLKTSKMTCPVQKPICKLTKKNIEKKPMAAEAYVDLKKYSKYQPGFCHESIGSTLNHGYIRIFETKWLSYENDITKKASHSDYLLWEILFVVDHLKDNPTLWLDNGAFKSKYCESIFFKDRSYDLNDFKEMNTSCFGNDLLKKYETQKTDLVLTDVQSRFGFVFPSKRAPVAASTYQAMIKHGAFSQNILPKRISLLICRFRFN